MPLEITTRIIKSDEIKSRNNGLFDVQLPYNPIFQWGYGRMDSSTPGKGLATSGVVSCTVVVLHCPSTSRTVVSHSPNFLFMSTFVPMIDYITGGQGDQESSADRHRWMLGLTGSPSPIDIEVVVIRGSEYAQPAKARSFGHEDWMSDFRNLFNTVAHSRSINANIVDSSRILSSRTVLIDKGTARITYIAFALGAQKSPFKMVEFRHKSPYTREQRQLDLFIGNLAGIQDERQDIHLQWDVDRYRPSIPLTGLARELLRSKMLKEPEQKQSDLLRAAGTSDFISGGSSADIYSTSLRSVWDNLVKIPCELCGQEGRFICVPCRGARYCGAVHQKEHWKSHKEWCRNHKWGL
jgi:MYND finger